MKIKKSLKGRISCTLDRVEQIRAELLDCIRQLVDDNGEVEYHIIHKCFGGSYEELRSIGYDNDGKLVVTDENYMVLSHVDDFSVDALERVLMQSIR